MPADLSELEGEERGTREECGIYGTSLQGDSASRQVFFALYALNHRGQESAGIASYSHTGVQVHKGMGLVSQVFNEDDIALLKGSQAIGHTRYSTAGGSKLAGAQPFVLETDLGQLAVAHNGQVRGAVWGCAVWVRVCSARVQRARAARVCSAHAAGVRGAGAVGVRSAEGLRVCAALETLAEAARASAIMNGRCGISQCLLLHRGAMRVGIPRGGWSSAVTPLLVPPLHTHRWLAKRRCASLCSAAAWGSSRTRTRRSLRRCVVALAAMR